MRVILVPVADRPECGVALTAAFRIADELGACGVIGCHIRPHRDSGIALPVDIHPGGGAGAPGSQAADPRPGVQRASRSAHELLGRVAREHGFEPAKRLAATATRRFVWMEEVGHIRRVMPILGPLADLIVVSRPRSKKSDVARRFVEDSVLLTTRPVLVVPANGRRTIGRRVLVAWNRSPEAMRAVTGAMAMLARADQVVIGTAGRRQRAGPQATHLKHYLATWGVRASIEHTRGQDDAAELTQLYADTGSDMLLMGAYSRSRLREAVFGGMTHHMLYESRLPVMVVH